MENSLSPTLKFDHSYILGVRADVIAQQALISLIDETIRNDRQATITNLNINAMEFAYKLDWFREFTNFSDVVICDGFGIKLASKFFYGKDLFRYTHMDWFNDLASLCAANHYSMFFLGTRSEIVEKAARKAEDKFSGLPMAGFHHGFFDKTSGNIENEKVIDMINSINPDVLIVGFGMPIQEKWLLENSHRLKTHVIITAGGFFDYLSGETRRAPTWMTDHGMEWLGRLIIDPGRLWRRYLLGNPLFFWRVIKHAVFKLELPYDDKGNPSDA